MKKLMIAMVIGILGSVLAAGLGVKWNGDYTKYERLIKAAKKIAARSTNGKINAAFAKVDKAHTASYILMIGGLLSLVAAIRVKKMAKISGGVMLAVGILPAIFIPDALVFTFLLLISGTLALIAKPETA